MHLHTLSFLCIALLCTVTQRSKGEVPGGYQLPAPTLRGQFSLIRDTDEKTGAFLRLRVGYEAQSLSLYTSSFENQPRQYDLVRNRISTDLRLAVLLPARFDLGIVGYGVIYQNGADATAVGLQPPSTVAFYNPSLLIGWTYHRKKLRISPYASFSLPLKTQASFSGVEGKVAEIGSSLTYGIGALRLGMSAGITFRGMSSRSNMSQGTSLPILLGLAYRPLSSVSVSTEIIVEPVVTSSAKQAKPTYSEMVSGVQYIWEDFTIASSLGVGFATSKSNSALGSSNWTRGPQVPAWRGSIETGWRFN